MVAESETSLAQEPDETDTSDKPASRLIDHVEVDVEIMLGATQMTVADLGKLKRGDVLEVDRYISEAVDIRVNDRTIGRGEIVTVDDKFAIRVTQIGD